MRSRKMYGESDNVPTQRRAKVYISLYIDERSQSRKSSHYMSCTSFRYSGFIDPFLTKSTLAFGICAFIIVTAVLRIQIDPISSIRIENSTIITGPIQ